ncbi:MAG: S49 family peptidase [Acidobacteriota bacterium]
MNRKLALVIVLVLLFLVVAVVAVGGLFVYFMNRPASIARGTVLEVNLGAFVPEVPPSDPLTLLLESDFTSVWDLYRALERAARDDRISAVSVEISPLASGWGQVEELRELLAEFRNSGKPVSVYLAGDLAMEKEIYLASAADHIGMNPNSSFLIDGLMAEVVFMRRTLDKLGVKAQFIQFKEFKSPETYSRQSLTPEVRQMLTEVLSEIQGRFLDAIAEDRAIPREELDRLVEVGILPAERALEVGLVDALEYRHEIRDRLKGDLDRYRSISVNDYLKTFPEALGGSGTRVAVVGAVGTIVSGKSEGLVDLLGGTTLADRLRQLREDDSIRGVILRVDSPGGSAVGSDLVWEEVCRLEDAGKPVVVSMSGVAASGGYYISMGARRIVSQPSTITGSIGVLFGKFDLSGLYNWLGMDIERIKLAPNSDLFSMTSSLSEAQIRQVTEWVGRTYTSFVSKAAEGRRMSFDELEAKARGRIYTGAQAQEAGLVDVLGGMHRAVQEMRDALGLPEDAALQLELFPKPKTLLEALTSGELLGIKETRSWIRGLLSGIGESLERPGVWMLVPEIRIQ